MTPLILVEGIFYENIRTWVFYGSIQRKRDFSLIIHMHMQKK